VKKRLARWTFLLFRSRTRRRYQEEFEDLLDELIGSGETARHLWLDIALAASRDRLFGLRQSGRVALAVAIVLTATLAVATWTLVGSTPAPLGLTGPTPAPIDRSTGPQTNAKDCPNPPKLSGRLPAGSTVSPPSLGQPAAKATQTVAGHTYSLTGTCAYTLTVP
jgi:hypothetical protein